MNDVVLLAEGDQALTLTREDGDSIFLDAVEDIFVLDGGVAAPPSGGGGDKHYEQDFNPATSLTITHNLSKRPAVTIIDSAGTEIEAEVAHLNNNQLIVTFAAMFGGKVICN